MFDVGGTVDIGVFDQLSSNAVKRTLLTGAQRLFPGYFALVMATGIVSLAADSLGMSAIAWAFLFFNLAAYAVLWLFTLVRLVWFLPDLVTDLRDDASSPGFLTIVAGTAIVGTQFMMISRFPGAGLALLLAALLFWLALMYIFLSAVTVRSPKPTLEKGINGGWLVAVVSTQSLSVLATLLAPTLSPSELTLFLGMVMFLLGGFLYIVIITLVFYRFAFFPLTPGEFRHSYWINMGATAVSSVAASTLALSPPDWVFLSDTLPFIRAVALLLWAVSTWWIPLLVILEIWRYVDRRFPVRYDPRDWDIVFPLGMYAFATFELSKMNGLEFLAPLSSLFFVIAVLTWVVMCAGLFYRLASKLLLPPQVEPHA